MPRLILFAALAIARVATAIAAPDRPSVTLDDVAALHDIDDAKDALALSPAGDALAFFEVETDLAANRRQHNLLALPLAQGARPMRVGDGGDMILSASGGRRTGRAVPRRPAWSPSGDKLAYLAEREGRVELWVSDRAGNAMQAASLPGDANTFFWSREGALFVQTNADRDTLAAARALHRRDGFRLDASVAPGYALAPRLDETQGGRYWRIADGAVEISRADYEAAQSLVPTRIAEIAALDPSSDAATPPLGVFARIDGQTRRCEAERCGGALDSVWTDAQAAHVLFTRREGHGRALSALYVWTPRDGQVRILRRADERISACAVAAAQAYCLQDSATQPRRILALSLASGRTRVLYDPNPQWRPHAHWRVERLDAANRDGEASFAHLVYPQNYRPGRRYPLVIVQYLSRGFLRGGVGGEVPIYPLAARGYIVLSVDRPEPRALYARMSAEAVLRQTELDGSENAMKLEAIEIFLRQLIARGLIDEDRIAITGMSDGAETVYAALLGQRRFAAAIAASQPRDPSAYWLSAETHVRAMQEQIGYLPPWDETDPAWRAWWAASPFSHADEINTPLLLNLSESEALYAAPLIRRLRLRDAPLEAFLYPGGYHIKSLPSHLAASQARTMAWIEYWLCGRLPADPALARDWEEMRHARALAAGVAPMSDAAGC